ncbi:putative Ig domain-containing protein [Massilia pinisoli]|uniref:Ig domain-containing protein n=1 Tax=Massilia pinisoli TaxID=1772194 RepID=A0ABT1ZQM6_9BURK|nr:putative Ig domain-containing protein [Massilia pinisoli]MCS0582204.1 putative Ig domain-containing protein [Massilia pinisoli]
MWGTTVRTVRESVLQTVARRFATALRALDEFPCRRGFIALAALATLTACGGDDRVATPKNLLYQQPPAQLVGDPIPQLEPTVEGTVDAHSVSPSLPDGLTIDAKTDVISGTPNEEVDAKSYVVTATNKGGSTSFTLQFSFSEGEHTEAVSPGNVTLVSVDPSKPVGLATPLRFDVTGTQINCHEGRRQRVQWRHPGAVV